MPFNGLIPFLQGPVFSTERPYFVSMPFNGLIPFLRDIARLAVISLMGVNAL